MPIPDSVKPDIAAYVFAHHSNYNTFNPLCKVLFNAGLFRPLHRI